MKSNPSIYETYICVQSENVAMDFFFNEKKKTKQL